MRSKLPWIGGMAALLAGVGVIASIWSNGTNPAGACASDKHAPLPAAAQKALAAYASRIRHDVTQSPEGTISGETWDDPLLNRERSVNFDSSGKVDFEFAVSRHGKTERMVNVENRLRVWTINERPANSDSVLSNAAAGIAQGNWDKVASGRANIVGRERVDGRETLHLREVVHPQLPKFTGLPPGTHLAQPPAFRVDTWVDPLTYLTVQRGFGPGATGALITETWLPRTPANIAKTKLVIPRGFTHEVPHVSGATSFTLQRNVAVCQ